MGERSIANDETLERPRARALIAQRNELAQVLDALYISGVGPASDLALLRQTGITHIINMAAEIPDFFPELFTYLHIMARDYLSERLGPHFTKIAAFVRNATNSNPSAKVLIHCQQGVSRSAAAVLACLMINERMRLGEAMDLLKQKRQVVEPNATFMMELRVLEQKMYGTSTARRLSFFDPGVDKTSGLVIQDWRQSLRNVMGRAGSDMNDIMDGDSGECKLLWKAMRTDDFASIGAEDGVLQEMVAIAFEMFGGSDERDMRARSRFADVLREGYLRRQNMEPKQLRRGLETVFKDNGFADLKFDVPLADLWARELLSRLDPEVEDVDSGNVKPESSGSAGSAG